MLIAAAVEVGVITVVGVLLEKVVEEVATGGGAVIGTLL